MARRQVAPPVLQDLQPAQILAPARARRVHQDYGARRVHQPVCYALQGAMARVHRPHMLVLLRVLSITSAERGRIDVQNAQRACLLRGAEHRSAHANVGIIGHEGPQVACRVHRASFQHPLVLYAVRFVLRGVMVTVDLPHPSALVHALWDDGVVTAARQHYAQGRACLVTLGGWETRPKHAQDSVQLDVSVCFPGCARSAGLVNIRTA